ncbi:hypothetical protein H9Q74_008063 [Fusarium xylarioides]|nr:hypothetical protein H9Q71_007584 [Fusarium xylarioides]KAG5821791.1 hypothetical protein H9Q74_008063 [Fusarium xylarioides]
MASIREERDAVVTLSKTSRDGLSMLHGPSQPMPIHKTFGRLLREQAAATPSALLVASHHQNKSLTYSQADARSDNLAKGLASLGVRKGDRVAILMGNEIEYVETFFSCTKLGAPITLVNYGYSEQELHSVLSSCRTSTLVMVPFFDRYDYRDWIPHLKDNIPSLRNVIIVHGDEYSATHCSAYEDVILQGSRISLDLGAIDETLDAQDIMNLQFTSGSTGLPKASALTHSGIYNAGRFISQTMYLKAEDLICLPVPLFYSFGLIIGLATVTAFGASIIIPDNKFNIKATLACIPKYKCTGLYGVTTMFVAEMAHPNFDKYDLLTLRFAILAGSAVPETLVRKVWAKFGITQTHTNWGLTESSSIVTITRDTDTMHQQTITSRRLFPGFSARIADPSTGLTVPRGQQGEILLRRNGIQACYFANDAKTAEAHQLSREDGLMWFHTRDKGYFNDDRYFVITGQIKDLIIRGGENIAPLEIEERLVAHPAVAQASVIGVPDDKYGKQICAFLEPASEDLPNPPSDEELRTWVVQTLAKFKQPKFIIWLGLDPEFQAWPKTASGKLRKPDLRQIATRILQRKSKNKTCLRARL